MTSVNSNSIDPFGILQGTSSKEYLILVESNCTLVHPELPIELVKELIFFLAFNCGFIICFEDIFIIMGKDTFFRGLLMLEI